MAEHPTKPEAATRRRLLARAAVAVLAAGVLAGFAPGGIDYNEVFSADGTVNALRSA